MTENDFTAFPEVLKAGTKASDSVLIDAATGSEAPLSDYWAQGPVMIEFGSIT